MKMVLQSLKVAVLGMLPLPVFADEVLLTLHNEAGETLMLDRLTLETLPQKTVETSTIWTEGVIEFRGPLLLDVLHRAGIDSGLVELRGLNDYRLEMEVSSFSPDWPIIATRREGQPFGVRDNGPLWVIYPFDRGGQLADERTYAASVWQLITITELP